MMPAIPNLHDEKPEGIEGYVDMLHYEHIHADDPKVAAKLV